MKKFKAEDIYEELLPVYAYSDDEDDEEIQEWVNQMQNDMRSWRDNNLGKEFYVATSDPSYWGLDDNDVRTLSNEERNKLESKLGGQGPADCFSYDITDNTIELVDEPNGYMNMDQFDLVITPA